MEMWLWRCGCGDVAVEMWLWRCGCGDVAVEKDDEAPLDGEKVKRRRTRDRAREERELMRADRGKHLLPDQ